MATPELTVLEVLQSISTKLDQIATMLAMQSGSQDETIRALRMLGNDWPTIGKLTGLNADAARKRLDSKGKKK